MRVAILTAYGGDDPDRVRAYGLVRDYFATEFPDWLHVNAEAWSEEGWIDPELFSRSAAVNEAASLAPGADVYVLNDADSLCPPEQVRAMVELALEPGPVLAFGHTRYRRLTMEASRALTSYGEAFAGPFDYLLENAQANGCCAIRRELFEQVGGYDERYQGWGYEDLAFNGNFEQRRVEGDLVHLWHPMESLHAPNETLYYSEHR